MKTRRILLISGDKESNEFLNNHLLINGFEIHIADDLNIALELSKFLYPDLIIIDEDFKKSLVNDAIGYMRLEQILSGSPIIYFVNKKSNFSIDDGFEHGAFDVIEKSINIEHLTKRIKAFFVKLAKVEKKYEEKLDKLRSDISFALPHEFRTSLAGILGFSNMISNMIKLNSDLSKTQIEEISDMANSIIESGKQLHRLTENFLYYSQIQMMQDRKDKIAELRRFTIYNSKEIIQEVISTHFSYSVRKDDFITNIENAILNISYFNFHKLIYEVVDNAVKFSKPGSKIFIQTSLVNKNYSITIKDTGRGMTNYQIENIGAYNQFDRYVYEQQGAGLGMIIAKLITILHGGEFYIESELGKGTQIKLTLPIINSFLIND